MNEMSVNFYFNETLSKTNFPLGRIKVHLILSYLILGLLAYVACFVLFWLCLCYGRLSVSRCFSTSGDVSF